MSRSFQEDLYKIIEIARFAPSVHNSQPWQVEVVGENSINVVTNMTVALKDGDPTGRETMISIGIFCEAIVIVARDFGWEVMNFQPNKEFINLEFKPSAPVSSELAKLLLQRSTDRSIYKKTSISNSTIHILEEVPQSEGVSVLVITDPLTIHTIAQLTARGIKLALHSPSFRRELSHFLVLPWSKQKRGILVTSLSLPWLISILQPLLIRRGSGIEKEGELEIKRWDSASAIIVVLADGDIQEYWINAGRTYLRVSLAIEQEGLNQATSASIIEASNYHEDIEQLIGTNKRILSLIRVGKGTAKRVKSPRVNTSEIITFR